MQQHCCPSVSVQDVCHGISDAEHSWSKWKVSYEVIHLGVVSAKASNFLCLLSEATCSIT